MSTAPRETSPAYASLKSAFNYLDHLASNPLPSRIDKSVMSHLNHGTRVALISSLRYLKLVDGNDVPTDLLERLLAAKDADRKAVILEMIRAAYPFLFDGVIDLTKASSGQFQERFKEATGAAGTTAEKAITLFLALAAEAGLQLSPHLTQRKKSAPKSGNGASRKSKAKSRRTQEEPEEEPPLPPTPPAPSDVMSQLLAKFPPFDPGWSEDLKKAWFDGFDGLMKRAGSEPKK